MILIFALSILHSGFFLWLTWQWKRIPERTFLVNHQDLPGVSIIVPVRNEQNGLSNLLTDLSNQSYPQDRIEIIVVNDHSTDDTAKVASDSGLGNLSLIHLEEGMEGKKNASSAGVARAKHNFILCTDGDCRIGSDWAVTMVSQMEQENLQMLTGPVRMSGESFLQKLQAIEFSGLIGFGAVTLRRGHPGMCNGANLGYRKSAFDAVDGYDGNRHIPSGDDEFLLQKIWRTYPGQVEFCKSQEAVIETAAKSSFSELLSQRRRWTSKWKFHKGPFIKLTAVVSFADFLVGFILPFLLFLVDYRLVAGMILLRIISEMVYLHATSRFFRNNFSPGYSAALSLIYPLYAVFLGIASIFGSYSWKGRKY